ncbi:MAG: hypothetical protein JWQ40_1285 [Segetibacter sp.]|nr:hypothetical protein [Segetibacter sp.]
MILIVQKAGIKKTLKIKTAKTNSLVAKHHCYTNGLARYAIYGHQDKWFILGRTRFQRFPLLYVGIGKNTSQDHPATIGANYFVFRQRILRKIVSNFFLGLEIDYRTLFNPH